MERQGINKAYNQPTNMADEGTRLQAGKDNMDVCDAAHHAPFTRNASTVATPRGESELVKLRELQLGSNGYQSNGYDPKILKDTNPAPVRGFGNSTADKGGYQGK